MHKRKYFKSIISLTLSGCLFLSGCTTPAMSGSATPEDFDTYMDDLFLNEIVSNTINLHYTLAYPENFGITDYEVTLGSISASDLEESTEELTALKDDLLRYDTEHFSEQQKSLK